MFTGAHMSHSATHVFTYHNHAITYHVSYMYPSHPPNNLANACLRSRISAYAHAVYRRTCSNTPSIICTGSHPLHPLTNNRTKRERGVGTGGSQYPMTLYPSLHAISRSSSSPQLVADRNTTLQFACKARLTLQRPGAAETIVGGTFR